MNVSGTVRTFDDELHSGTVFLDDGAVLVFDADAFAVGGLRLLRVGQRVRLRRAGEGGPVNAITLATFAWADEPYVG